MSFNHNPLSGVTVAHSPHEAKEGQFDSAESDLLCLAIAYAGCFFLTAVALWTIAHPTASLVFPFDIQGFVTHLGGLR